MHSPLTPENLNYLIIKNDFPININFNGIEISIIRFTRIFENKMLWFIPSHYHISYELHYISKGKGYIEVEGNKFTVTEGDLYITAPYVKHTQISDEKYIMEEYCIECSIVFPDSSNNISNENIEINNFKLLSSRSYVTQFSDKLHLLSDFEAILKEYENKNFGYCLRTESMLVTVVLKFFSTAFSSYVENGNGLNLDYNNQRITKINNYLDVHFAENISVSDVAKIFYLSTRQLDRIFMDKYGVSFHKYLTQLRITKALELLKHSEYNIKQIATQTGFSTYQRMFRTFKNFGYPAPFNLRKEISQGENEL